MDRISQLTDDLLLRILSLVPTKDVPVTSLVSKRWEPLWSLVSKIEIDDSNSQYDDDVANYTSFTQFVNRTLLLNKAPILHTFILDLGRKCHSVDIRIWIDTAVSRGVRKLKVQIHEDSGSVNLPRSLYNCKTLKNLTLIRCLVSHVLCLPSLKILRLANVGYASLPKLLSGCPNLEEFVLLMGDEEEGKDFIVAMPPCLQILSLNDLRNGREGGVYVIEAPCVEDLQIVDDAVYDSRRIENMPNLVKAYVDITQGVTHEFLRALASARRLYLCVSLLPELSKIPTMVIFFYRLVHLELNTCAQGWWDLLTQMLENSPKLASLKFDDKLRIAGSGLVLFPTVLKLSHGAVTKEDGDLEMATCVIKNATRLKTATITPRPNDDEAKYRIVTDLVSICTPSPSCQLLFD